MPNSFHHVFENIKHSKCTQYLVRASYLEIYNEEVRDLLKKHPAKKLEIKEKPDRGVYVRVRFSVNFTSGVKYCYCLISLEMNAFSLQLLSPSFY